MAWMVLSGLARTSAGSSFLRNKYSAKKIEFIAPIDEPVSTSNCMPVI